MPDEIRPQESVPAPAAGGPPPLRAAMLVWPGTCHAQTWLFLWAGVAFLIGSLLPWYGHAADTYVLADGRTMEAARYQIMDSSERSSPAMQVVSVLEKRMNIGAFLVLLSAVVMVVAGVRSVWNRRLLMSPILTAWFIALLVVNFYRCPEANPEYKDPNLISGWKQLGDTFSGVFSSFGDLFAGSPPPDLVAIVQRAGIGFYVTSLTTIFLLVFVILSMFLGKRSAPDPAKGKKPLPRK